MLHESVCENAPQISMDCTIDIYGMHRLTDVERNIQERKYLKHKQIETESISKHQEMPQKYCSACPHPPLNANPLYLLLAHGFVFQGFFICLEENGQTIE